MSLRIVDQNGWRCAENLNVGLKSEETFISFHVCLFVLYFQSQLFQIIHSLLVSSESHDACLAFISAALQRNHTKAQLQVSHHVPYCFILLYWLWCSLWTLCTYCCCNNSSVNSYLDSILLRMVNTHWGTWALSCGTNLCAKLEVSPPLSTLKHTFVDKTLMHYWKQSAKGAPFVAHDWVRMPPPPCFFPFIMSIFPVPYGFRF